VKVFAPGLSVQVIDGAPVMPSSASGSGVVKVYPQGLSVEVRDVVSANPVPVMLGSRALNMGKMVQFYDWSMAGRYVRHINNVRLSNTSAADNDIQITANDHTGVDYRLGGTYAITVRLGGEGQAITVASMMIPAGTERITFQNVNLNAIPSGWHLFDIVPPDDATAHPYWMYVGANVPQTWAPVQTGSFGITHEDGPVARWGKVPVPIRPGKFTMSARDAVPFSHAATPSTLYRRNISPCINGDPFYLRAIPNDGRLTCLNSHAYDLNNVTDAIPDLVLRDGPFGVGTLAGATHLEYGTADIPETGGFVDNLYFCDPWSMGKIRYVRGDRSNSGEIVRLAGYRHGPNGLELLGDWSAVPVERRGFHELWGLAWDKRTYATDLTADPIPEERNLRPHITGIVAFVSDSQRNRICKLEFDPRSHATPPKVTEHIVGMSDPWDVVCVDGVLYTSERTANKITAWDASTGAFVRTVLQGAPGLANVVNRRPNGLVSIDLIRAQPVCQPEGLFYQDGWLYFASIVMGQVKRVHLTTGALEVVCTWVPISKSEFAKISVSDGTFGPRGSVFVSTWEVNRLGAPWAYLPNGMSWGIVTMTSTTVNSGPGGKWEGIGYSMASCVARGRLAYSGADYGIVELSLSQVGDVAINKTLYEQGKKEYDSAGYRLTHGHEGFGQWGQPLPWGLSAACDYYLTAQGHA
jgi:hypothetical protein